MLFSKQHMTGGQERGGYGGGGGVARVCVHFVFLHGHADR